MLHPFFHEVQAGGQQPVCLIPSTLAFLIVSAYFEFYKSANHKSASVECQNKIFEELGFIILFPARPNMTHTEATAYHHLIAPPQHQTALGLCDCKSRTFKASIATAMGKHFVSRDWRSKSLREKFPIIQIKHHFSVESVMSQQSSKAEVCMYLCVYVFLFSLRLVNLESMDGDR